MKLVQRFWTTVTGLLNIITFSPFHPDSARNQQIPFLDHDVLSVRGPSFKAPGRLRGTNETFTCEYPKMKGWVPCSTPQDRTCWLHNPTTGANFSIYSDYESIDETPLGITRYYNMTVGGPTSINVDGEDFDYAQLFDGKFPGPWIQACWGDRIVVNVSVSEDFPEGTSIHWHGLRQLNTTHMGHGVPGISQCPIAPGSYFVYNFTAMQYGSSWYHSHYSLQYANGLLGPLTIHGPSIAPYDEAPAKPLFISDWNHNDANARKGDLNATVLLGGIGNLTRNYPTAIPTEFHDPFNLTFIGGKKYLLRVINTAYNSAFLFTIDNHLLNVVSADFVPINNYTTDSTVVQIGQRYNVIVEANPQNLTESSVSNFWIRTYIMQDCRGNPDIIDRENYMKTGIIRYDESNMADPNTEPWADIDFNTCRDETGPTGEGLSPVLQWFPDAPSNPTEPTRIVQFMHTPPSIAPYPHAIFALETSEEKEFLPLRVDWQNITFLNLDNDGGWPTSWIVLPEDYTSSSWVYLTLSNPGEPHPIHLHGHDFAVLYQGTNYSGPSQLNLNNPPRRDVVNLPAVDTATGKPGTVIIAFKSDNPGPWLMHCHIADHASGGLALQIMEDREAANEIWKPGDSPALNAAGCLCDAWKTWCAKFGAAGCNTTTFQTDSGV
ncbi:uncharacterized protein PV09_07611 [Verruconis gallopava]|uniref:Laccase n=1 Tax=Verruconis gallopava TaxID=253628 RepID=A0A0D1YIZ7_9PEZI|nr:uncharacterized protein PV09_07611 [Verruconis gallopava]KIW00852.1 hypothetical protein PV09_07611 [Verruconis gallopava]